MSRRSKRTSGEPLDVSRETHGREAGAGRAQGDRWTG